MLRSFESQRAIASLVKISVTLAVLTELTLPVRAVGQDNLSRFKASNKIILNTHQPKINEKAHLLFADASGLQHPIVGFGGGCFVSGDGYMLTANHVLAEGNAYFVGGLGDIPPTPAEVKLRDPSLDLALIKLPISSNSPLAGPFVESSSVAETSPIFIWAYLEAPGGNLMQFFRTGVVSNNSDRLPLAEHALYIETSAIEGTSGSPVFLRDGRPIGIVTQRLTVGNKQLPAGIISIVPGELVNKFLKAAGIPGY